MANTIFQVLKKRFEEDKASAIESIASGGAKDFAQYKDIAGYIRGLETCIRNVEDLSRNYMDGDDE
tara:strand:- start:3413 stop:3610 length:198 start_codon:yes stop_codon:yes gene_type:complete